MQNGGGAEANVANLQTFMDDFVCAANTNNTGYFFFEFMDEPWKTVQYGGVEGYWGVFDQKFVSFTIGERTNEVHVQLLTGASSFPFFLLVYSKQLKSGLTLPTCSHN